MKRLLALLLLALPAPALAQAVKLPATLNVPTPGWVILTPESLDGDSVAYFSLDAGLQALPPQIALADRSVGVFTAAAPGTYRVRAVAAKVINGKALLSPLAGCIVTVGPPGPGPGPDPPGPTPVPPGPTPTPAPIPADGLHMLVVVDQATLTPVQADALSSRVVRAYLDATCPKEGKQPTYRIWPANADATNESQVWKDAFARPRKSVPWIVVSNGRTGYEGPLPANTDDLMKLLRQFGG